MHNSVMSDFHFRMPLAMRMVFPVVILIAFLIQPAPACAKQLIVVAYGDSLVAGYGLPKSEAFPHRLEQKLRARGHSVKVINAGITGDTTARGLARLTYSLPRHADAVILELGANDALRGIDPRITAKNLEMIVANIKKRDIPILLAGMLAPPHMGKPYRARFKSLFYDIARRHDVLFYPFFLKGVALRPNLNQFDGIHPNSAGVNVIVNGILPAAEKLVIKALN